jgi:hypothetical protein
MSLLPVDRELFLRARLVWREKALSMAITQVNMDVRIAGGCDYGALSIVGRSKRGQVKRSVSVPGFSFKHYSYSVLGQTTSRSP